MRHDDGDTKASQEKMQQWMKQTIDWINTIAAQKKFVSGTGLPFQNSRIVHSDKNGDRWSVWEHKRNGRRINYH